MNISVPELILTATGIITLIALAILRHLKTSQKRKKQAAEQELRQQRQREERLAELRNKVQTQLPAVVQALKQFQALDDFASGYLNYTRFHQWNKKHHELHAFIVASGYNRIGLPPADEKVLTTFMEKYLLDESYRARRNKAYILTEKSAHRHLFDRVEKRKLDGQQREAIITDEDNNLVVAGAGSGKTTTIIGKIKYLTQRHGIDPSRILAISFTRKSCDTLEKRLQQEGVESIKVKTFHSLGLEVIRTASGEAPRYLGDTEFQPLIEQIFSVLLKDASYLGKAITFLTAHLRLTKDDFEFSTLKEKVTFLKANGLRTIKGEVVKSRQELQIANWLLFHGLSYEYEPLYPVKYINQEGLKSQYKPDFLIRAGGTEIYLEHFGINAAGQVPSFFRKGPETLEQASEKYQRDRQKKIETHRANNTNLIETFSHQFDHGQVFTHLQQQLRSFGITATLLSPEEQWKLIEEYSRGHIRDAIQLFATFLTLQKSNNLSLEEVDRKIAASPEKDLRVRALAFMELYRPIFTRYQSHLQQRELIDFNDMINRATDLVLEGRFPTGFDYIVVDEFQDISMSRYHLLKALRDRTPGCRTFCVGDDWQSIFRFTGSDINLFTDFPRYFGVTATSRIERTYRFSDPLIRISSAFIQKNPAQLTKQLQGPEKGQTGMHIIYSPQQDRSGADDTPAVCAILEDLSLREGVEGKTIFMMGRYNHDIKRLKRTRQLTITRPVAASGEDPAGHTTIHYTARNGRRLTAEFLTAHKSKGLEADIVLLLNCNAGRYGFPSEIADDPLLNLLLSSSDAFENAEERRLFYVTMTRAREAVYFVADPYAPSLFMKELETELTKDQPHPSGNQCPLCFTGTVSLRKEGTTRKGDRYRFYGCANYLFGCDYSYTEFTDATPAGSRDPGDSSRVPIAASDNAASPEPPSPGRSKDADPPAGPGFGGEKKPGIYIYPPSGIHSAGASPLTLSFKPLETKVETLSEGSKIYRFKLNAPMEGQDTVCVYENVVHAYKNGFKYVELSNYPFKYSGTELHLVLQKTATNGTELWLLSPN